VIEISNLIKPPLGYDPHLIPSWCRRSLLIMVAAAFCSTSAYLPATSLAGNNAHLTMLLLMLLLTFVELELVSTIIVFMRCRPQAPLRQTISTATPFPCRATAARRQ
jgi:hypothetical protein